MGLVSKIFERFQGKGCHGPSISLHSEEKNRKIAIVGSPNVGKSVLFHRLTGTYVTVSNYPGTTVEVFRGKGTIRGENFEVIDTPGMYSFLPITEEERVTRSILLQERPHVILHVVDAKNLERMLPLTLQLLETGLPVILVLNIIDEAEKLGIRFDFSSLEKRLEIPINPTISTSGQGIDTLKEAISGQSKEARDRSFHYEEPMENLLRELEQKLQGDYGISKRSLATLLLQEDLEASTLIRDKESDSSSINSLVERGKGRFPHPISYELALERQRIASRIVHEATDVSQKARGSWVEWLSRRMISPWSGIPILLFILYYGIYWFVGDFGAGVLVDFLEGTIFEENINPWVSKLIASLLPWQVFQELFVGEYGVITLGVRYAVALILPIVTTFFLVFSVLEDTGYLPRLSLLIDRIFKAIGLTGRAVIPMVLGLGCDTMATMVTRTLPTRRERIIATLLLALAIPCSAQLGVILALFEGNPVGLWIWLGVIACVFLFVGFLSSKVMPGEKPSFYMEIPPLRFPKVSNVAIKTYSRVHWYFKEIFPLFILASVFIWLGQITGVFDFIVKGLEYPIRLLGLPDKAAVSFLFGFFRRDYGAAGFFDMKKMGLLAGNQLVVASVTLTLFVPCVAQFLINIKERGMRIGFSLSLFVLFFSFGAGYIVNLALATLGVKL
ncbi:MAG: ferrous iron transport protein B [Deltaproteobacteria bacterium RBG_13_47_9]|nr:MAG: ferrous iron transport protein B [Deltaproteobacteria bacterium RBG_13_47_9]